MEKNKIEIPKPVMEPTWSIGDHVKDHSKDSCVVKSRRIKKVFRKKWFSGRVTKNYRRREEKRISQRE